MFDQFVGVNEAVIMRSATQPSDELAMQDATGVAPVISYHYGAGNTKELKSLLKKSSALILISSALMFGVSELMAKPLAGIFVGYDAALLDSKDRGRGGEVFENDRRCDG